jgi:hypothetical protein
MSENNSDSSAADEPVSERRRLSAASIVVGVLLGVATVVAGVLVGAFLNRNPTPLLTREAYEVAAQRWDAHGPASYDLDLELSGNRPGKIHVEVRGGQATRMVRDGVEPKQQRTWYYWTVPGQMDMIAEELDMAEDPAKAFNAPGATAVIQRAEFDPQYGYPRVYHRIVQGTDFEILWKVTKFEPK